MKTILIIIVIAIIVVASIYFWKKHSKEMLVDKIMLKYPDANDKKKLMGLDIDTLQKIFEGTLK